MKKKVVIVLVVTIITLIFWLGFQSFEVLKSDTERKNSLEHLSGVFGNLGVTETRTHGTVVLIYFNSDCEHCQWEIAEIRENLDQFENVRLAFISYESENKAVKFLANHQLNSFYLNVDPHRVIETFGGGVPQLLIYSEGKLRKHFKGEVRIDVITKELDNS